MVRRVLGCLLLVATPAWAQRTSAPRPELIVQSSHTSAVTEMVVSPDSALLATAAEDGTIRLWQLSTNYQIRTIPAGPRGPHSLAFSRDGRQLAAVLDDDTIRIWDVRSGRERRRFYVPYDDGAAQLQFSDDGRYLVSTRFNPAGMSRGREPLPGGCRPRADRRGLCEATLISVWDLQGVGFLYTFQPSTPDWRVSPDEAGQRWSIAVSGPYVIAAYPGRRVDVRALATGRPQVTLAGALGPVAVNTRAAVLVTQSAEGLVTWDLRTWRRLAAIDTREGVLAITAQGLVVTAQPGSREDVRATFTAWEGRSGRQVRRLRVNERHECELCTPFVSADGRWVGLDPEHRSARLAIWGFADRESAAQVWDLSPRVAITPDGRRLISLVGRRIWQLDLEAQSERCSADRIPAEVRRVALQESDGAIRSLAFPSQDGLLVWDAATGTPARNLGRGLLATSSARERRSFVEEAVTSVDGMAFGDERDVPRPQLDVHQPSCPDGASARAATGKELPLIDAATLTRLMPDVFGPAVASPAGDWAAGLFDVTPIIAWRRSTGTRLADLRDVEPGERVNGTLALAASNDGSRLASARDDEIQVWDAGSWQRIAMLGGHEGYIAGLAFSPNARLLASTGEDDTVRIWDLSARRQLATWRAVDAGQIAFTPDGAHVIVTVGRDLVECDLRGREVRRFSGAGGAFALDAAGKVVITGGADGLARLWDRPRGTLLATLVAFGEATWLVVTPDGLFDGSADAWRQLLWRFNNDSLDVAPIEAFFRDFYRQGLLADLLRGERPRAARSLASIDRRLPEVALASAGVAAVNGRDVARITMRLREAPRDASHATGTGIRDVRLFRNGSLVRAWRGDVTVNADGSQTLTADVPLVQGPNRLSAYAFNRSNIKGVDADLFVSAPERARTAKAWIVAIGITNYANKNMRLAEASSDADAVAAALADAQRRAGVEPVVVPIKDREATRANLLLALQLLGGRAPAGAPVPPVLQQLRRAEPEDSVFVFFAGHGATDGTRFYLVPRDVGYAGTRQSLTDDGLREIEAHGLSDLDLADAFEAIDAAHTVLLVDACHAGQALADRQQSPTNAAGLAQLAYDKGMFVLAAAESSQQAAERRGRGGLLAEALLSGLANGDEVTARSWLMGAVAEVPRLGATINVVQHPQVFFRRDPERVPLVIAPARRPVARTRSLGGTP